MEAASQATPLATVNAQVLAMKLLRAIQTCLVDALADKLECAFMYMDPLIFRCNEDH